MESVIRPLMCIMPGVFVKLEANDEGDTKGIQCPVEKVVFLKPGCKVMLLWNVSEKLRNGSSGTFVEQKGSDVIVCFPDIGKISLKRERWCKHALSGLVVGSRLQFPYAITCHKLQGLTLPTVVVHCSREFVPGLIYVSFSRVAFSENLQVVGFLREQLIVPGEEFLKVCEGHCDPISGDGFGCCRNRLLSEEEMVVVEPECDAGEGNDDGLS